jgi:hypothetical protein
VSLLPAGGPCAIGMVRAQHTGIWTGISLLTDDITDLYDQWRREGVAFDRPARRPVLPGHDLDVSRREQGDEAVDHWLRQQDEARYPDQGAHRAGLPR